MIPPRVERERLRALAAFLCSAGAVAERYQMPVREVATARGGRRRHPARELTIYLSVVAFDVPQAQVAVFSKTAKQNVQRALRKTEDRRDDPMFDALVADLEMVLRAGAQR